MGKSSLHVAVERARQAAVNGDGAILDSPESISDLTAVVRNGDVGDFPGNAFGRELLAALKGVRPSIFVQLLHRVGALKILLPEIDCLFGVPQPKEHHPEGDVGTHTLLVLDRATQLTSSVSVRFASLVHDVGKGVTPQTEWPRHLRHDQRGVRLVREIGERLAIDEEIVRFSVVVTAKHLLMHRLEQLKPSTVLSLLELVNPPDNPDTLGDFIIACMADGQGRGDTTKPYPSADLLVDYVNALTTADLHEDEGSKSTVTDRKKRLDVISTEKKAWFSRCTKT